MSLNRTESPETDIDLSLPDISDEAVQTLVDDIDRDGFGFIADYVGARELEQMRSFVRQAVRGAGGEYIGFKGKEAVAGSTLDEFGQSPIFQDLFRRIYRTGTGRTPPAVEFYQILRCLAGRGSQAHSLIFHYDSYVLTALIPVEIPATGKSGDLVMLPNTRGIRRSYAANLMDKLLLDNRLTQTILRMLTRLKLLPLTRIKMVPGNLYVFWGYRSIHTNEACDPEHIRATALFHYANPHEHSWLNARLRSRQMS